MGRTLPVDSGVAPHDLVACGHWCARGKPTHTPIHLSLLCSLLFALRWLSPSSTTLCFFRAFSSPGFFLFLWVFQPIGCSNCLAGAHEVLPECFASVLRHEVLPICFLQGMGCSRLVLRALYEALLIHGVLTVMRNCLRARSLMTGLFAAGALSFPFVGWGARPV